MKIQSDKVGGSKRQILTRQAAIFAGCWLLMQPLVRLSKNSSKQVLLFAAKICAVNSVSNNDCTGKNNGFPFLDILGYLKNTRKNPKFGKVRQIPIREFPTKFPNWDLSHFAKFGIFMGIL